MLLVYATIELKVGSVVARVEVGLALNILQYAMATCIMGCTEASIAGLRLTIHLGLSLLNSLELSRILDLPRANS